MTTAELPPNAEPARPPIGMRLLSWITAPSLIYGIGLGIALVVAILMTFQLEVIEHVIVGFISILVLSVIGAICIYLITKQIERRAVKHLQSAPQNVGDNIGNLIWETIAVARGDVGSEEAAQRLSDAAAALKDVRNAPIGIIARFFSFGFLLSVLGGAATFAIFAATYIQAERLKVQNELIESQLHLAEAQRQTALSASLDRLETEFRSLGASGEPPELNTPLALRIVALSRTFRPYRFVEYPVADTFGNVVGIESINPDGAPAVLVDRPLSQERARLLSQLLFAGIQNMSLLHELGPNFQFSDFRGFFLRDRTLNCFDLRNSDFRQSDSFAAQFRGALLNNAKFDDSRMVGAQFSVPDGNGADACPTTVGTFVRGSAATNLEGATFDRAVLVQANFSGAQLNNASFKRAVLSKAKFHKADIATTDFTDAVIGSSDENLSNDKLVLRLLGEDVSGENKAAFLNRWVIEMESVVDHPYLGRGGDDTEYAVLKRIE